MPWSPGFAGFVRLLNVDGFAVGIKRALDANFLAFILLQGFLVIDIISLTAGVLQNVLVSGLGNGAAESLAVFSGGLRLGIVSTLSRGRLRGLRLIGWLLLLRLRRRGRIRRLRVRLLRVESCGAQCDRQRPQHPQRLGRFGHFILRRMYAALRFSSKHHANKFFLTEDSVRLRSYRVRGLQ